MVYVPASSASVAVPHFQDQVLSPSDISDLKVCGIVVLRQGSCAGQNSGFWEPMCFQVGSDDEQVRLLGLGVCTGELDLFAEVVALVAGCHDRDCALLDVHINFVALDSATGCLVG